MKNAAFDDLLERVVKASGAVGWTRRNIRRELESHMWEAVHEFEQAGTASDEIPRMVIERFGSPEIIGQQLSLMHGVFRLFFKTVLPAIAVIVAIAYVIPGDGNVAQRRYREAIEEKYLDVGWYERAEYAAAYGEVNGCINADKIDGIGITYVPGGHILITCQSKWLVLKFLPVMQLSGPDIDKHFVLHMMKAEGGLRSTEVAFGEDNPETIAQIVLENFLHALAVGAGNAPTDDLLIGNIDEPAEMGEAFDRQLSFGEAVVLWEGDLSMLNEWNPDIDPENEAALFAAACERQLQCYEADRMVVESVSRIADTVTVVLTVWLRSENETVNATPLEFQVTRFEDGYPNDWTDDIYRVTNGFAYLP